MGTDYSGVTPMGNLVGVSISDGATGNQVGDTINGGGNLIAFSKESGILISDISTINNKIFANSIYSNGGLGIDLGSNGVTSNDTDDPDTGPNNLQNFPVLESVNFSTGSVTITGSLNSVASKTYKLQFFASKLTDNTGYGEGQTYLGSKTVTTDASGNAAFTQSFPDKKFMGNCNHSNCNRPIQETLPSFQRH